MEFGNCLRQRNQTISHVKMYDNPLRDGTLGDGPLRIRCPKEDAPESCENKGSEICTNQRGGRKRRPENGQCERKGKRKRRRVH